MGKLGKMSNGSRFSKELRSELVKYGVLVTVTNVKEATITVSTGPKHGHEVEMVIDLKDPNFKKVREKLPNKEGKGTIFQESGYSRDEAISYMKEHLPFKNAFMVEGNNGYIGWDNLDDEEDEEEDKYNLSDLNDAEEK